MRVGDTVHLPCVIEGTDHGIRPARVQYIHPQERFCVVQVEFDFGAFRETVYLGNRARPRARELERKKETA